MNSIAEKWSSNIIEQNHMSNAITNYLQQFSSSETIVVKKLLSELCFYDYYSFASEIDNFKEKLISDFANDSNIIFVSTIRDSSNHHSDIFLGRLLPITVLRIYGKNKKNMFVGKSKIIIVDDYSGSGKSVKYTIERLQTILKEQIQMFEILIAPMIITKQSYNYIENFCIKMKINYKFYKETIIREAKFISTKKILTAEEEGVFYDFSNNCIQVEDKYTKGFYDVEDLIAFSDFTPNNTLGFLWWEYTELYIPLFKRNSNFFSSKNCCICKEYITNIKNCVIENENNYIKNKTLLAMFMVLNFEKEKCINLIHLNESTFNKMYSELITDKVIDVNNKKGENFEEYVDVERFDLVMNSINGTKYDRICRNLISTIEKQELN